MSAGENCNYPVRLEVFFTLSADSRHALKVIGPVREAGPNASIV